MRAAPTIGQHNDEILHPILGGEQLARLRDLGVIGAGLEGA
jgi:hypothetical protein